MLVPYFSHIDPPCDEALRELERRGYAVRRLGGYAAIDQARNKLATDALLDGFEETMWIDADVAFEPDAVDRLRSHHLPIVTGVCPKKGRQELALRLLPGTRRLRFGNLGGLAEIMYAGTGFLHVRREVYERIQYEMELPVCNERFPRPLIPFFQPLIYEDGEGPWDLGEDWSFSQRARSCGYSIMADTSIRLWHIGHYRYGWEDAGDKLKRFADFTLNFPATAPRSVDDRIHPQDLRSPKTNATHSLSTAPAVAALKAAFPWPLQPPAAAPGFADEEVPEPVKTLLRRAIRDSTKVVVDFGASLGQSTQFLATENSTAVIIAVENWIGRSNDQPDSPIAIHCSISIDTFLANCWEHRNRIVPIQSTIAQGQQMLADYGVTPDLIYLHCNENDEVQRTHLEGILQLFPRAILVGDGYLHLSVRKAVTDIAQNYGLRVEVRESAWRLRGLATGHVIIA